MPEPFDEYIDQFTLGGGALGLSLNFQRSSPKPSAPGSTPSAHEVGSIRMGLEHFKVMAFLMKRQVEDVEGQLGIVIPIPVGLMNALKIAPEDWDNFWKKP